jgi:hypothetical protein
VRPLAQRPVDRPHDFPRVGNSSEREVMLGLAGGIELNGANPQQALEHGLPAGDVLNALKPGLLVVTGQ